MNNIELIDPQSGSTAKIAAGLGLNCYEFVAHLDHGRSVDVIDSASDFAEGNHSPSGHGIPILFPYPNRIREGKFTWDGKDYLLPSEKVAYNNNNAIHGFCLDRPWRVTDQNQNYVGPMVTWSVITEKLELEKKEKENN